MRYFTATIADGASADIDVSMLGHESGFQVSAVGAGVLTVSTEEANFTGFVEQSTQTAQTKIYDLVNVNTVRLAAAGSSIIYKITMLDNKASTPTSNWDNAGV
jgi:predicted amidohydrolase